MNLFEVTFGFTFSYYHLSHWKHQENWNVSEFSGVYFVFDIFLKYNKCIGLSACCCMRIHLCALLFKYLNNCQYCICFYTQLLQWAFFRNGDHNKLLLVTSEAAATALGISLEFGIISTLATKKLVCVAQTNWCCFHPSCHVLSRVWRNRAAILNLTETCSSMMAAICHRNSKPFMLHSFATLTGKAQPHIMSNGTVSILWSTSQYHCCGTSGDSMPFNM